MSTDKGKDRDDLIEAGKSLKKAKTRESRSSGLGVHSKKKAWGNKYPGRKK